MSFFFDTGEIEPDKDTAFLDAVVSMSSNDSSVFVVRVRCVTVTYSRQSILLRMT
ncbi:hypothetical protein [Lactiplantibacillus plantarum]|uniref:hypothetical protein n=1 Tax=Lactiplantibacillus plantarum TaxID=1590 RepID=UPI0013C3172F|nr:hypothetical protein [Lactiplantibacillus plantarum]